MGLFSKIANIFYDEVEEEVKEEVRPKVKQEVNTTRQEKPRIEEIKLPNEEVKKESSVSVASPIYSERDLFKTSENKTFRFPMIDEEEEEEVKPKTRSSFYNQEKISEKVVEKSSILNIPRRDFNRKVEEKLEKPVESKPVTKTFKPSPIISPVYGIQDKNYTKEEMMAKREPLILNRDSVDMNYDSVRRKAYGTLEDELENTLTRISANEEELSKTMDEVNKYSEEENNKSIEDLLNEIEINKSMSVGEAEEMMKDMMEEEETSKKSDDKVLDDILSKHRKDAEEPIKEEKEEESFDKTLEHDLFNLIDSMYEEKDV